MALDSKTELFFETMKSLSYSISSRDGSDLLVKHHLSKAKEIAKEINVQARSTKQRDIVGSRPLSVAARSGDLELVEMLLECGAKVKVQNSQGESPLHEAIKNKNTQGQAQIIQCLVKAGAKLSAVNHDGDTPLIDAIRSCSRYPNGIAAAEAFMQLGSNLVEEMSLSKEPLITHLFENLNVKGIEFMMKQGALKIDPKDPYELFIKLSRSKGLQSLFASSGGQAANQAIQIFDMIVAIGGRLTPLEGEIMNASPLLTALERRAPMAFIKHLEEHGAHLKAPFIDNDKGYVMSQPSSLVLMPQTEQLETALNMGLDPNWTHERGNSLLMSALTNRYATPEQSGHPRLELNIEMAKILLKAGANPNPSASKNMAFLGAICNRFAASQMKLTALLLDHGVDPNGLIGEEQFHPLMAVFSPYKMKISTPDYTYPHDKKALYELLISKGADINAPSGKDKMPICLAAGPEWMDILKPHIDLDQVADYLIHRADPKWIESTEKVDSFIHLGVSASILLKGYPNVKHRLAHQKLQVGTPWPFASDEKSKKGEGMFEYLEAKALSESLPTTEKTKKMESLRL